MIVRLEARCAHYYYEKNEAKINLQANEAMYSKFVMDLVSRICGIIIWIDGSYNQY